MKKRVTFLVLLFYAFSETATPAATPFSDPNWVSMNGLPGTDLLPTDDAVVAAVADNAGNLYIGGNFTLVGDVIANHIAKWNGTNWTALGSGTSDKVYALAVSGNNLYVGGAFTN